MRTSTRPLSAPGPLDRRNFGHGPERGNDIGQMLGIDNLDIDQHFEEVLRAMGDLEVGDVSQVLADDRRGSPSA